MPKKVSDEGEKNRRKRLNKPSDVKPQSSKRKMENICVNISDTSSEMDVQDQISNLLQEFGCNMKKSLISKQKKMKGEIQESAEISADEMLEIFNAHKIERQMYLDDFHTKLTEFFEQENANGQADKEKKMQLEKQIKHQEKLLMELMTERSQYLETVQKVSDIFFKSIEDLNRDHHEQFMEMNKDMNEKLKQMQKKVQVENQQQAMEKLRNNLQNLLG